uniref:Rabaptin GTPase-Rab5 binding domain-containing protein n=1 Tax=Meloidogyne javanica TaxID=6303 RepID=A0A915MFI2_MELJA
MTETGGGDSVESASVYANSVCEMCGNYEVQLQTIQSSQDTLREKLAAAKELYEKYGKELTEERHYRKELEIKFAALNEETEGKIQQCITNTEDFEQRIVLLSKKQEADLSVLESQLELARNRQKELQEQLVLLNERYEKLLHLNSQCAEEMREQQIELPQAVEELQFLALQLREELITERAAREHERRELNDELAMARQQLVELEICPRENEE